MMRVEIKVFSGSSREEIIERDGLIKVYVKAAPDKGKANKAVIDLIAREYKVRKSHVRIVKGEMNRVKLLEIAVSGKR